MNKVIILEGPDGSGKTTLAEWLVNEYGFKRVHEGPPPTRSNKLEYYGEKLMWALRQRTPVVFDRFHLGELVYAPIHRDTDELTYAGMRLINRVTKAYDVMVRVCVPDFHVAYANWRSSYNRGIDYLNDDRKYKDSYHRFVALTSYFQRINFSHTGQYQVSKAELGSYAKKESSLRLPKGTVGNMMARYLMVGEQANHPTLDIPFFHLGNSSGYLNTAIGKAKLESQCAFTNALTVDGKERDLKKVVDHLPLFKTAVALGRTAEAACVKAGIPHTYVQHPSWWKRFNYHDHSGLVARLQEATCV